MDKIQSLGALTEELWESKDEVTNAIVKAGIITEDDRANFLIDATSPLDLTWALAVRMHHRTEFSPFGRDIASYFIEDDSEKLRREFYRRDLAALEDCFWKVREEWRRLKFGVSENGRSLPKSVLDFIDMENLRAYCLRPSEVDPSQWCYTPDEKQGKADRQVRMRPGKLLKKLLPDKPDTVIQAVATVYTQGTAGYGLMIARTRQEVRRVYVEGPDSCMACREWDYLDGLHPAEVYASPDTAVAYIQDFEGRITARAVLSLEDKLYGRVYGNNEGITAALAKEGYRYSSDALQGCRILRIELDSGVLCPYIDNIGRLRDVGDYLIVDVGGYIDAQRTDGRAFLNDEDDSACCAHCDDSVNEDDCAYVDDVGSVCYSCIDNDFCDAIVEDDRCRTHALRLSDHCTWLEVINEWVLDSVLNNGPTYLGIVHSEFHGEWITEDDAVWIESMNDYVSSRKVTVVQVGDDLELSDDCVKLYDDTWVLKEGNQVFGLGSESDHQGEYALASDVRPAIGAPEGSEDYVLHEEVVHFGNGEVYLRDCVSAVTADHRTILAPESATYLDEFGIARLSQTELTLQGAE